jgi:hypothetical protein
MGFLHESGICFFLLLDDNVLLRFVEDHNQ